MEETLNITLIKQEMPRFCSRKNSGSSPTLTVSQNVIFEKFSSQIQQKG